MSRNKKLNLSNQLEQSLIEEIVDIIDVLSDRLCVIYETETSTRRAVQQLERVLHAMRTSGAQPRPKRSTLPSGDASLQRGTQTVVTRE